MQTVVEAATYLRDAKEQQLSEEERVAIVDLLAADPEAGQIMPGCGGARKLRVARPGAGKSGGYRVITYVAGADAPVFLLALFATNERVSLSKAERNALAALTKHLAQ